MKAYAELKNIFSELSHFNYIKRLLVWDEAVMMPEDSGKYRAEAMATFNQLIQTQLSSRKIGELIAVAKDENLRTDWVRITIMLDTHCRHVGQSQKSQLF